MRANRAYRLIVSKPNPQPAFFADRDRIDRIEVVAIDDGEVVLFWTLPAKDAARLLKSLRADLARLNAVDFIEAWRGRDSETAPL